MTEIRYVIALDVGGSSVKSGVVDTQQHVTNSQKTPIDSHGSAEEILSTLTRIIQHHLLQIEASHLLGVGFGFPSPFDYPAGVSLIEGVDKYEAIFRLNIRSALQERLKQPELYINFRNDAEAALIGESKFGAGQPYRRLLGLTLGTGLGSAFIVDNQRITTGYVVPEPDGMLFHEAYQGQWADEWFSTRGLLARIQASTANHTDVSSTSNAADAGDPTAKQIFHEFGVDLGRFVNPYLEGFEADALLITGGIAGAIKHFRPGLSAQINVPIVAGTLGAEAALLGTAEPLLGL